MRGTVAWTMPNARPSSLAVSASVLALLAVAVVVQGCSKNEDDGSEPEATASSGSASPSAAAAPQADPSEFVKQTIRPGKGIDAFVLGDDSFKIRAVLGAPDRVDQHRRHAVMRYDSVSLAIDVSQPKLAIEKLRFGEKWKGRTTDGIGIGDSLETLTTKVGGIEETHEATAEEIEENAYGTHRVLYRQMESGKLAKQRLIDQRRGVAYWLDADGKIVSIVVQKTYRGANNRNTKATRQAAVEAAAAWARIVDDGGFAKSWETSAELFKKQVKRDDWLTNAATQRAKLGELRERTVAAATFQPFVRGGLPGEYVNVTFRATFTGKKEAIETIIMAREPDDVWRVAGYTVD